MEFVGKFKLLVTILEKNLVLFIDYTILFSTPIRPLYPIHSLWGYTRCFSFIHIGHVGCFVCLFVCYCWFVVGLWSCFVFGWEHRLDAFTLFFFLMVLFDQFFIVQIYNWSWHLFRNLDRHFHLLSLFIDVPVYW